MTTIYYAVNPHPSVDKVWGDFMYPIEFNESRIPPRKITKSFFKKYWNRVPVIEKPKDKEKIFAKYNRYDLNPLSSTNDPGQKKIRSKGIKHTSMSIGDMIKVDGQLWIVAGNGFVKVEVGR